MQEEGVAKNSSDPRQAYPEVKLQGGDLVRAVDIVRAGTRRIFVLSNHRGEGGNGHRRRVPGSPSSGTPPDSQVNLRIGIMV